MTRQDMQYHHLRSDQMEDLTTYLQNDPLHGLEELWETLIPGWRDDSAEPIQVTHHQLGAEQGQTLAQASLDGGEWVSASFPAGLWLNYGPSTAEMTRG